ncbi:hypothetical protein Nepgr_011609 [Nepenthes gracilis]|uniref:Uncharacterized protein n=1 Tax=Nepenthes gracilis TaxID=150966 RepID=A0AAD3SEH3_NEPGR|nr:hypothetical protein Nepgr_011609 [Nepenthes gracilis]
MFCGGSGINLEIGAVSVAGPSMEDSKVASMLCVGADCSTNLDLQNGPPIALAGSPTGRPKLSPDHTTGSGTVSPLLPPSDEVEHCHSEKLMSVKHIPGHSGASFEWSLIHLLNCAAVLRCLVFDSCSGKPPGATVSLVLAATDLLYVITHYLVAAAIDGFEALKMLLEGSGCQG